MKPVREWTKEEKRKIKNKHIHSGYGVLICDECRKIYFKYWNDKSKDK